MALYIFSIFLYAVSLIATIILSFVFRKHDKKERSASFGIIIYGLTGVFFFYLANFVGVDTDVEKLIVYDANMLMFAAMDYFISFTIIYVFEESDLFSKKLLTGIRNFLIIITVVDSLIVISGILPVLRQKVIYAEIVPYIISETKNLSGYLASGGFWYIPHFVIIYTEVIAGLLVLGIKIAKMPGIYAPKYFALLLASLLVFAANIFMRLQTYSFFIDISLPFLTLMLYAGYSIKYNDKPYFLLMSMRRLIFNRIEDPVLLFDNKGILVFLNQPAQKIFAHQKGSIKRISIERFLKNNLENQVSIKTRSTVEQVNVFMPPADMKMFKLDYDVVYDKRDRLVGSLLTFSDISILTEKYEGLDGFNTYDEITSLPSSIILQKELTEINIFNRYPYSAAVCDISGLSIIKGGLSEDFVEEALRFTAGIIRSTFPSEYFISYSNECFFIFAPTSERLEIEDYFTQIHQRLNEENPFKFIININYGISVKANAKEEFQNVITNAQNELFENKMMNSEQEHKALIESINGIIESYEEENEQSINRELDIAEKFAKKLKLSKEDKEKLTVLVKIHDIGKLPVPDRIALNRNPLTLEEKTVMSLHTVKGSKIARLSKEFKTVEKEILCHHEWWNGNGFPNGCRENEIPYISRIFALIDAYEEMTTENLFKTALSKDDAVEEILARAGEQFDPELTKEFVEMMK